MKSPYLYAILLAINLGYGDKIMANKKVQTYLEEVESKRNSADTAELAAKVFTGITAGVTLFAGLMGATGEVSAEIGYKHLYNDVVINGSFDAEAFAKRNELIDSFTSGAISQEEYDAGIANLYSREAVVDYAKNSQDKRISNLAKSYESTKDMGDIVTKEGIPTMLAFTTAGAAAWTVTDAIRRKYDRILREYKKEHENEGM